MLFGILPGVEQLRKESIFLMGENRKGKFVISQEYVRIFNKIKLGEIITDQRKYLGNERKTV